MTEVKLRDYQVKSIEDVREHYRKGHKRVILQLPTGAGKTTCFSYMLGRAAERGLKCIMVVKGKDLVDQASKRLFDCGIHNHGVLQGNHWNYKPDAPIQVCSIDTLTRRGIFPEAGFIVIDECHKAGSKSFREFIDLPQYEKANFLSVSATPHLKNGMGFLATKVVNPIGVNELIELGYLVRPRYYALPNKIDANTLKIDQKTQDYTQASLVEAVEKAKILGDAVEHYKRHGENRPAIYFAVNVAASVAASVDFNLAGIPSEHVDAKSTAEERAAIIERFKSGVTKVITNCEVYTTGVDIPCVGVIILARPTASYNLYVQMCGRGTRPYPGKNDFIIFDHANNVLEHGFIEDGKECSLDGKQVKPKLRIKTCEKCYAVYDPSTSDKCPVCGHVNAVKKIERTETENNVDVGYELLEIKDRNSLLEQQMSVELKKLVNKVVNFNLKRGFIFYKLKEKFGHSETDWFLFKKQDYITNELARRGWVEPEKRPRPTGQRNISSLIGNKTV